ncbi:hypothetical protein BDV95DRAFT_604598 [Massariosphaeria phaeospora]|uniref:F-box domain-containing protein n=1 Tax=Massariosphaeria phaeospora TaxID=100035 RepID=A0A7C8IA24_9PLEO|nr:hypothetical protein BDV95DRAFT_604598 [Massariosphaeria phaeospora]
MAVSTSYAALVEEALRQVGIDRTDIHEKMRDDVLKNDFDAVVTLTLLICPKITCLTLGLHLLLNAIYLRTILCHNISGVRTSRFEYLSSLKLETAFLNGSKVRRIKHPYLKIDAYLPFLYLPALQDIEVNLPRVRACNSFNWPMLPPPKLLSLSTLRLPESSVQPEILHSILLTTPNLVSLEYDCWQFRGGRFDASAFEAALETVKNTLTYLKANIPLLVKNDGEK